MWFNVQCVRDLMQTEIHITEQTVPQPNASVVEMATENLKRHKSLAIDQIPAELIKAESPKICSGIHKL